MQDRRKFLKRGGAVVAGMLAGGLPKALPHDLPMPLVNSGPPPLANGLSRPHAAAGISASSRIPLVHCTDLYHPPQDPDDHVDLATIAALPEYDLRGVILDVTQKFLEPKPAGWDIARDPGYVPVIQLGHIIGKSIPVAAGPAAPLTTVDDDLHDRPITEQAGVRLLLDILDASPDPVLLSVVGSARVPAAAFNRAPALVRSKTAAILLNAGSTAGTKLEWNVGLDTAAYICLWRSGLPIFWYPCAIGGNAFNTADERSTHWKGHHATLFRSLSAPMRAWFAHALTGAQRGDVIGLLGEAVDEGVWGTILAESRDLWSTASLVMMAQRVLTRTQDGWRFLPLRDAPPDTVRQWRLDPIQPSIDDSGMVTYSFPGVKTGYALFGRTPGEDFGPAMAEALGALLGSIAR